jgi:hypothetical protein
MSNPVKDSFESLLVMGTLLKQLREASKKDDFMEKIEVDLTPREQIWLEILMRISDDIVRRYYVCKELDKKIDRSIGSALRHLPCNQSRQDPSVLT